MAEGLLDEAVSHLEFLGYTITRNEDSTWARHSVKLNILLKVFRGGLLMTSFLRADETAKTDRPGFLDFVNKLNEQAAVTRFYADSDGDLAMETWYPEGAYERIRFGHFLSLRESDIERIRGLEGRSYLE